MGCFSWKGKPELVFVPNSMNAQRYVRLLEDHLEPFGDAKHPNGFRFQRDNAKSHTAGRSTQHLDKVMAMPFFLEDIDLRVSQTCVDSPGSVDSKGSKVQQ